MPTQLDLICLECPLAKCDQRSLWCLVKFVTEPNEAQRPFLANVAKAIVQVADKSDYDAAYRRINRQKKRAYDRERYQQKKAVEIISKCHTTR